MGVDYHSKWIEVGFCEHPTAEVVVQFLEKLACREGYPREVVSDCGSAFTSDRFASYLRSVGVSHVLISPYHPQSSGLVERANKSIKAALQTADLRRADRAECLQAFLFAYRSTVQATTGRTPAELLHGRQMRGKLSAAVDVGGRQPERRGGLKRRVEQKQAYQKSYFDKTHRVKTPDFRVGDQVRHRLPPQSRKGKPRFSRVKRIRERRGPASFLLDDGTRVHADRLTSWGGGVADGCRDEQSQQQQPDGTSERQQQPQQQQQQQTQATGEPVDARAARTTRGEQFDEATGWQERQAVDGSRDAGASQSTRSERQEVCVPKDVGTSRSTSSERPQAADTGGQQPRRSRAEQSEAADVDQPLTQEPRARRSAAADMDQPPSPTLRTSSGRAVIVPDRYGIARTGR